MLHQILNTTWKDLKILFKDFGGLATLFLMPLMFIVVMSIALQGLFDTSADSEPTLLPVANLDNGPAAAAVIDELEKLDGIRLETEWDGAPLTQEKAEEIVASGWRWIAVVFPADFSAQIDDRAAGGDAQAAIQLIADPTVSLAYTAPIEGMVFSAAESLAESQVTGARISAGLGAALAALPAGVNIDFDPASLQSDAGSVVTLDKAAPASMHVETQPDTFQQNVPGYTVLGVFFIVGAMSTSILTEKREGTFRRLLASPLSKPALLLGKILPYYLVNLIQIAIMFGIAHLLFGMGFGDPLALALVSLGLAAAATGMGIMVAALGKTDAQVSGLSTLLTLTLSALGGCMMPISIMPDFLQSLSRFIPHAWAMQGFQDVLVRGYGVSGILPEVGILFAFAVAFFAIGVWRFRFD